MAGNPVGDRQGVGRGFESLRGTDTPGVEKFPWGEETSGVTLEGNRVPGTYGQGRGGNGNYSATRDTKEKPATRRREEMASGQEPAPPLDGTQGKAEGGRGGST